MSDRKICNIKTSFENCSIEALPALIEEFSKDTRPGVVKICQKYEKILTNYKKEILRTEEMKHYEKMYSQYEYIAGIDEVGRGPLAGPVVTCAVILPKDFNVLYINDSKKLTAKKREELYELIIKNAISVGIGIESPQVIDNINILQATYSAMRQSISKLSVKPDLLLNDAVTITGVDIRQVPIIKGDDKSISIASASIVAKVTRDRMMDSYDEIYKGYDFASNKGYGSAKHIEAIKKLGPTPIHRMTFIKNFLT